MTLPFIETGRDYIEPKETAQFIRQALKEAFWGVKFSVRVRNYHTVNIGWADGPTVEQVEAVVERFQSAGAMHIDDYVPTIERRLDGERVTFGAKYVFADRQISDEMVQRAIDSLESAGVIEPGATPEKYRNGELWRMPATTADDANQAIRKDLWRRSQTPTRHSMTAARVSAPIREF